MQVQIRSSFLAPDSPRPFLPGELVTVADATAKEWIADGRAVQLKPNGFAPLPAVPPPARRTREKAVTA